MHSLNPVNVYVRIITQGEGLHAYSQVDVSRTSPLCSRYSSISPHSYLSIPTKRSTSLSNGCRFVHRVCRERRESREGWHLAPAAPSSEWAGSTLRELRTHRFALLSARAHDRLRHGLVVAGGQRGDDGRLHHTADARRDARMQPMRDGHTRDTRRATCGTHAHECGATRQQQQRPLMVEPDAA